MRRVISEVLEDSSRVGGQRYRIAGTSRKFENFEPYFRAAGDQGLADLR